MQRPRNETDPRFVVFALGGGVGGGEQREAKSQSRDR